MCDKAFSVAKNPKHDGYQKGLASMVYRFFDKNLLHLQINLLLVVVLKMKISQTKNLLKNYANQLLENSRKKSSLNFYRQNLDCWSCWYTINK